MARYFLLDWEAVVLAFALTRPFRTTRVDGSDGKIILRKVSCNTTLFVRSDQMYLVAPLYVSKGVSAAG